MNSTAPTGLLQQPRPFFMIFFVELWERFGYYGVQGILAVFFVKQLGFSQEQAFITFGAFAALVPQHLMGFILGMWFLTQAAAFLLGGYVATFTAVPDNITDPLQTLPIYTDVFSKIGLVTLGVTVVMAIMVPWLNRMINTKSA